MLSVSPARCRSVIKTPIFPIFQLPQSALNILHCNRVYTSKRLVQHNKIWGQWPDNGAISVRRRSHRQLSLLVLPYLLQAELCNQALQLVFLISKACRCFQYRCNIVFTPFDGTQKPPAQITDKYRLRIACIPGYFVISKSFKKIRPSLGVISLRSYKTKLFTSTIRSHKPTISLGFINGHMAHHRSHAFRTFFTKSYVHLCHATFSVSAPAVKLGPACRFSFNFSHCLYAFFFFLASKGFRHVAK